MRDFITETVLFIIVGHLYYLPILSSFNSKFLNDADINLKQVTYLVSWTIERDPSESVLFLG